MLRPLSIVSLMLLALAACTESATTSFGFTSVETPTGIVSLNNISGSVRVSRGTGDKITGSVRVTASGFDSKSQAQRAAEGVRLTERGTPAELVIDVTVPRESRANQFDVDLDLQIPDGVAVEVATDNGSIRAEGVRVTVLDTTGGDIDMRFTTGQALAVTNDFPVRVESHQGDLDVRTTNGSVELISIQGNVQARTTFGSIVALVTPPPTGEVTLATTGGPIEVTLPDAIDGRLTAVTTAPGRIFVERLPLNGQSGIDSELTGFLGSGQGVIVDVRTTTSDVLLRGR